MVSSVLVLPPEPGSPPSVRQQPASYLELAHLNPTMLLTTFALSVVASLLAGTLPAWMAMQVTPAIQLKSQ